MSWTASGGGLLAAMNRRSFLAGAAAFAAAPALGAVPASGAVDVAIVGAGAAGIAAARRLAAAGKRFALIEAANHIGGRCITDMRLFGVPFDLGAHWIPDPNLNPMVKLSAGTHLEVYTAPSNERLRIGQRYAGSAELERFFAAQRRSNRAINEAARKKIDISCAQALPKDLGDLRPTIEFVLGPFGCGKDLSEVSVFDFVRSDERERDAFCRQGFGAILERLAQGLPVQLSTPVTRIDYSGRLAALETAQGTIRAQAVIVTVSIGVLAADLIKFQPHLPVRHIEAVSKLPLGSYDHVALDIPGNPLGLRSDDLVYEKAVSDRTAALLANVSGTSLCLVDVGGGFGRALAAQGETAMIDFAVGWLADLFGNSVKAAVKRGYATRWNKEPWVLGAFSSAAPGNQPARSVLMESINGRIWFAGEAVDEALWGTVAGAWESGERAADAVIKRLEPS
jgi:monoamine oxidase